MTELELVKAIREMLAIPNTITNGQILFLVAELMCDSAVLKQLKPMFMSSVFIRANSGVQTTK